MVKSKPLPLKIHISLDRTLDVHTNTPPLIVWTWPATAPGLTIGSARSVTIRPGHGIRKNADPVEARDRTLSTEALNPVARILMFQTDDVLSVSRCGRFAGRDETETQTRGDHDTYT